jgi:hypothetical protein
MTSALVILNGTGILPSQGGDDELCRGLSDARGDLYVDESGFAGRFNVDIGRARTLDDPAAMASTLRSV